MTYQERVREVLDNLGATLFCMGQDWKKGDGSALQVDVKVDEALAAITELTLEVVGEDEALPKDLEERVYVIPSRNALRTEQRHIIRGEKRNE